MKTILSALNLDPNASETEAASAALRLKADEQAILLLTGKTSLREAIGVLHAWKHSHEQLWDMGKEVAQMRARERESELQTMVELGIRTARLRPANREWALSLGRTDLATLKGYLETTTPLAAVAPTYTEPKDAVTLSENELAAARLMKTDPKKLAEFKAAKK